MLWVCITYNGILNRLVIYCPEHNRENFWSWFSYCLLFKWGSLKLRSASKSTALPFYYNRATIPVKENRMSLTINNEFESGGKKHSFQYFLFQWCSPAWLRKKAVFQLWNEKRIGALLRHSGLSYLWEWRIVGERECTERTYCFSCCEPGRSVCEAVEL